MDWQYDRPEMCGYLTSPDGNRIWIVHEQESVTGNEWDEIGEFIVKACNNHDKLVETLKYVYELYGGGWSQNAQSKVANLLKEDNNGKA